MKIQFSSAIKTLKGEPVKRGDDVLTLADVSVEALLGSYQNDKPNGKERIERYRLAERVVNGGEVEISTTEAALLIRMVELAWGTLVYGQVCAVLEGVGDQAAKN